MQNAASSGVVESFTSFGNGWKEKTGYHTANQRGSSVGRQISKLISP